jgi:hypothetical protein
VLVVAAGGVLAWAAAVPSRLPPRSSRSRTRPGDTAPALPPPAAPVPAIVTGGTPGWQITLIAVAAAVIAATAAAFLDRAGNTRRPPPPQDETRRTRPGLNHDHSPGPAGKTWQAQAKIIRLPS